MGTIWNFVFPNVFFMMPLLLFDQSRLARICNDIKTPTIGEDMKMFCNSIVAIPFRERDIKYLFKRIDYKTHLLTAIHSLDSLLILLEELYLKII